MSDEAKRQAATDYIDAQLDFLHKQNPEKPDCSETNRAQLIEWVLGIMQPSVPRSRP